MDLYLVSGFLGSGKTTLIINLSKLLMQKGKKIGVVTNDQGKYLVDTAFVNAADIPAVDVQSGCFCSHYPDLIRQLEYLQEKIDPDISFAEAIGSSANLSGTVSEPLLRDSKFHAKALICLADARLLSRYVNGETLPFSDAVKAIFESQINESDYLIVNKIDLLTESVLDALKQKLQERFRIPETQYMSAMNAADLAECLKRISAIGSSALHKAPAPPEMKKEAFKNLKWYEKRFEINDKNDVHDALIAELSNMKDRFKRQGLKALRFKCVIRSAAGAVYKCDIPDEDDTSWKTSLRELHDTSASVLVNARLLHSANQ